MELLTINLQTYLNFHPMYKTKHIYKSLDHKDDRLRQQRQEQHASHFVFESESDQDSSSGSLQELDFSYAPCQQEEYSIEHFIQNLQPEEDSDSQDSPQENQGFCYYGAGSELERINAIYMQRMRSNAPVASCAIRFDPTVRVKFFSDQSPAAEVCSAQQYAISQYQQTSGENRMF